MRGKDKKLFFVGDVHSIRRKEGSFVGFSLKTFPHREQFGEKNVLLFSATINSQLKTSAKSDENDVGEKKMRESFKESETKRCWLFTY